MANDSADIGPWPEAGRSPCRPPRGSCGVDGTDGPSVLIGLRVVMPRKLVDFRWRGWGGLQPRGVLLVQAGSVLPRHALVRGELDEDVPELECASIASFDQPVVVERCEMPINERMRVLGQ